jgi:ABC-type multidrug transport system ATPase subunit
VVWRPQGDDAKSSRFDMASVATFVEQLDNHEPFLTVRETLQFAGICTVAVPHSQVRWRVTEISQTYLDRKYM